MRIDGTRSFDAPRESVWRVLTRPEAMTATIPGLQRLDVRDDDHWTAHVEISIGLVRLRSAVDCKLVDKREPEHAGLHAEGDGPGGGVRMHTSFDLAEAAGGRTEMRWEADVRLTGPGAMLGGRVLRPLVERQVARLLGSLERQVAAEAA